MLSITLFTLHFCRHRIGLTREWFVALGLPLWTQFRNRCWGVFTPQGLLRAFDLWYCESYGI